MGNGILAPYTFMSSHKKNQSSTIHNGFAVYILKFAPFIDTECYYVAGSERVPPVPLGWYFSQNISPMHSKVMIDILSWLCRS